MIEKSLLTEVIGLAYGKGLDLAEIYVEEKQSSNILMEDNRIEKIHSGREKGAGIRVVKDYNTAIFEFVDTNVRQVLNHIQKEEQQHGEGVFHYMMNHGMYNPQ
jgi:predicted Zn-dependent protease